MNDLTNTEFAGFAANYQRRSHTCREFSRILGSSSELDALILEARPGIGATALCAEYIETLTEPGILLCANSGSRAGYSLPFMLDQALQQAYAILGESPREVDPEGLAREWHRTLSRLQRHARILKSRLHIVVDGLYQIPQGDERYLQDVVADVLALGNRDVKHIITWREGGALPKFVDPKRSKSFPVPPLSEQESRLMLESSGLERDELQEAVNAAQGIPAILSSIARLKKNGKLNTKELHSDLSYYYEAEWGDLLSLSPEGREILEKVFSFVVFSKIPLSIVELAQLMGMPVAQIGSLLARSEFIDVDDTGRVLLLSNTYREYLKRKFEQLRTGVLNAFVERIASGTSSAESVQLLPNYYEELGKDKEIVDLLTPDNLEAYLNMTQSLRALRRRNELGFEAAKRTNLEVHAYRFSLQTSIVRSLEDGDGHEARLAALASTGRLDAALNYALSETTKEGKLLLLSQYVRTLHSRGVTVDQVLSETIQSLISDVDLAGDRERTLSIAENLIGPFPDLSLTMVERASEGAKDYQDKAFTHLVLKAQSSPEGQMSGTAEKYVSKVSDSRLKRFLNASEVVFKDKSAADVKRMTAALDGGARAFLLRQWIRMHIEHPDALAIADFALDEVARDTSYMPTAADLRDLCLPLSVAVNAAAANALLSRIEAQRSAMLEATGTIEKLRLDLEIAKARVSLGCASVDDALTDIYVRVADISDDGLKLECFGWFRSSLNGYSSGLDKDLKQFVELCDAGIKAATEACLEKTGEHIDVFKGAMIALVESAPGEVLALVEKLNTQDRRDSAYALFVEGLLSRDSKENVSVHSLIDAINRIVDPEVRWPAIVSALRLMTQLKPSLDASPAPLIHLGRSIGDPVGVLAAWRWIVPVSAHYGVPLDLNDAESRFMSAAELVDPVWRLPEMCYWFVDAIAQVNREEANKKLDALDGWLRDRQLVSDSYARLVFSLAKLTVVAFAGVIQHLEKVTDELNSVFQIVDAVPSVGRRVDLLTDLAMRAYSANRKDVFERICDKKIAPAITNTAQGSYLRERVARIAYSALFLWNQQFADSLIENLHSDKQDLCRYEVILQRVTNTTAYEPYSDDLYRNAHLDYPAAVMLVSLIERMKEDSCLAYSISLFVRALTSRASTNEITGSQRAELAQRLLSKTEQTLPDVRNIKHDGWKIFCRAYCLLLSGDSSLASWKSLIQAAEGLSNISDSVFVLTAIAAALPKKLSNEKALLLQEAERRVGEIPSLIDRIRRSVALSTESSSSEIESALAKRLLTNAMADSMKLKDPEAVSAAQKQVIDVAYQLDKDFAAELVRSIDSDPARMREKKEATQRLADLKCKSALADRRGNAIDDGVKNLGEIAWDMLGSLNAKKIAPKNLEELAPRLSAAQKRKLFDVLGFYQWYLRNLQEKYRDHSKHACSVLQPLFEVTRLAALLAEKLGSTVCRRSRLADSQGQKESGSNYIAVPGVRDEGIGYVKKWLDGTSGSEVLICDPYFKPEHIDFIKELTFHKDSLSFVILSCEADSVASANLEEELSMAWTQIAHVEPPPLHAVFVTYEGNRAKHPVHDRWILCGQSGLRIGTSLGSFGISKLSELSEMAQGEVDAVRSALSPFVEMRERWLDSKRLRYKVVHW